MFFFFSYDGQKSFAEERKNLWKYLFFNIQSSNELLMTWFQEKEHQKNHREKLVTRYEE